MKLRLSRVTAQPLGTLTIVFLLLAPGVVLFYASYVFNPAHADNIVLYALHVAADLIGMITLLTLWVTILLDVLVPNHHRKHNSDQEAFLEQYAPSIDILITVAGEPLDVVRRTAKAAVGMLYPHNTFILDDGRSKDVEQLCQELGIFYVTRTDKKHAKSGNVNNGLRYSKSEFFSIFDADQVPSRHFIVKLLPYMANEKIAMVQSPQFFENTHEFIASGTAQAQEIFYKHVCPAKNVSDSAFCVGTNMVFRRKAIDEIGGIAQVSHSEDIWTSFLLHQKGWSTIFVNEVLARGQAPANIYSYFKQQLRWARGGLSMLFFHNPLFSRNLTLDQKVQYFSSNIFYLVGISIFSYILMPIVYLLFGEKPLKTEDGFVWLLHYLPYLGMYYGLSVLLLGRLRISTVATALASFHPYLLAIFGILFGAKYEWTATTSSNKSRDVIIMQWIWPHVFLVMLTLYAFVIGWYEPTDFWATSFNTIWAGWNMYLLLLFLTGEKRIVAEA